MKHIFLNNKSNEHFIVEGEKFHHIKNVLRINKIGTKIKVVYQNKIYETIIEKIEKDKIFLKIFNFEDIIMENINIDILFSYIDFERVKIAIEKLSEIGVNKIIFFKSEFSQFKNYSSNKIEKLKKISIQACEQSGNFIIPQIFQIDKLDNSNFEQFKKFYNLKFILNEKLEIIEKRNQFNEYKNLNNNIMVKNIKDFLNLINNFNLRKDDSFNILYVIGPEGGFSENEIKNFIINDFISVSLGKNILRAETAAISFAFLLKYLLNKY